MSILTRLNARCVTTGLYLLRAWLHVRKAKRNRHTNVINVHITTVFFYNDVRHNNNDENLHVNCYHFIHLNLFMFSRQTIGYSSS